MLIVSLASYVFRVYGYTFLTHDTVWFILCLEALHGVTFTTMYISAMDYIRSITPDEWLTTLVSILIACFSLIGLPVGSFFGGYGI